MNMIKLGAYETGGDILVNADMILMVHRDQHHTVVGFAGESLRVVDTVEEIEAMLNPMRAFSGKRDVGEEARQDTRTRLLIESLFWIPDVLDSAGLKNAIRKEVGEAAIEQYVLSEKQS
jgi:alpha-D-ribose 1-methylphosphonate 5-triphosphate synthase subunit PhnL